jgi:hypothetical protein
MKKATILFLLILISIHSNAQFKSIELYDVINILIPDSLSKFKYVAWNSLPANGGKVNFTDKATLNKITKKYQRSTNALISISGKTFSCEGETNCLWAINLEGDVNGYNQIAISPGLSHDISYATTAEYLFGKNKAQCKLLKRCEEVSDMRFYEVKIPGKKIFWMQSYIDGGTMGSSLYITVYLNKADMPIECW